MQIQAHAGFYNMRISPLSFWDVVYQAREGPGKPSRPTKTRQSPQREPLFSRRATAPRQTLRKRSGQVPRRLDLDPSPPHCQPLCQPVEVRPNGWALACRQHPLKSQGLVYSSVRLVLHQQNFSKIYQTTV